MNSYAAAASPLHLLLPLLAGMVYVIGALFLKRATDLGANIWRTVRICNFITALAFIPLTLLGGKIPSWQLLWQPALVGGFFMAGQILSIWALSAGDVSVATPVFGIKIPIVALLSTFLIRESVGANLWIAAFLSSAAIALLNFSDTQAHHQVGKTILIAALAATAYAFLDVLVQHWSPAWGAGSFLPLMMGFVGAFSIALGPFEKSSKSHFETTQGPIGGWIGGGAICLALQALMIVSSIALYGQATMANVLYSSRGLWSVIAVWLIGHWFASRETNHSPSVLARRFIGAALLMVAILIVLLNTHRHTYTYSN